MQMVVTPCGISRYQRSEFTSGRFKLSSSSKWPEEQRNPDMSITGNKLPMGSDAGDRSSGLIITTRVTYCAIHNTKQPHIYTSLLDWVRPTNHQSCDRRKLHAHLHYGDVRCHSKRGVFIAFSCLHVTKHRSSTTRIQIILSLGSP